MIISLEPLWGVRCGLGAHVERLKYGVTTTSTTGHHRGHPRGFSPKFRRASTTTEGDLILTGELTGDLLALDARTGKVLLRSPLDGPAAGGVVTYNARGVQNVAIVSGFVGVYNSVAPEIGGGNPTVTIFRLRGK